VEGRAGTVPRSGTNATPSLKTEGQNSWLLSIHVSNRKFTGTRGPRVGPWVVRHRMRSTLGERAERFCELRERGKVWLGATTNRRACGSPNC